MSYQWAGTSIFTRGTPPSRDLKMSHFELSCQMGENDPNAEKFRRHRKNI